MTGHIRCIEGDITRIQSHAIVNAANPTLLGGGGVDGAIHLAAGPNLREFCRTLGGCRTGEVKLSPAFRLPARYVIHTVGPVWGEGREEEQLSACYRNSLTLAVQYGCRSIAFPAISTGAYGYPPERAAPVAVRTIALFLKENKGDMEVILVCRGEEAFACLERAVAEYWHPE